MRQKQPGTLADMSGCAEAQAWAQDSPGIGMCGCSTAGIEMSMTAVRHSGETVVKRTFRHNFYIEPIIVFEPDAVAVVAGGMLLGPGLHRAIERIQFVECECWNGQVMSQHQQTSTVE